MNTNKKVPLRRCLATNEECPKQDLFRVVKNKEGLVFVDATGKANGRGAYIKKTQEAIDIAKKKNVLGRALECEIPEEVYIKLEKLL